MYRVLKDKGNNMSITVENTETKASVIIGKMTLEILSILNKSGYSIGDEASDIHLKDEWNLEVSDETGKLLAEKAFKMTKPIRKKVEQTEPEAKKKSNKQVDAMDVLLGFASYE